MAAVPLTSVARIDAHRLQTGTIGQRDYDRLSQAISRMSEAPIPPLLRPPSV